jgi:uncharacterized protein YceK
MASALAAAMLFVAGCSSNQSLKTTDGKTIVLTDGKPQVDDDTGWCHTKMRKPAGPSRSIAIR